MEKTSMKCIKIITSLFLLFFLCIVSESCSSSPHISFKDTYIDGQDHQYMFLKETNETVVSKGNNGYYCYINNFLYHIDDKTLKATPLCNKSDCLHNNETDSSNKEQCNAYVDSGMLNQMYVYNNDIYIMCSNFITDSDGNSRIKNSLMRISNDGSKHEEILSFENEFVLRWLIHRGYLFYLSNNETELEKKKNESEITSTALYKISVNQINDKKKIFSSDDTGYYGAEFGHMTAYGNHIFLSASGYKNKRDYTSFVYGDNIDSVDLMYSYINYNFKEENFSFICDENNGKNSSIVFDGFSDDKFFYHNIKDDIHSPLRAISVNGGKPKDIHNYTQYYERFRMDDNYFYSFNYFDDDVYDGKKQETYTVYDKKWNKITTIPLEYTSNLAPGDNNFIFDLTMGKDKTSLYYINKSRFKSKNNKPILVFSVDNKQQYAP